MTPDRLLTHFDRLADAPDAIPRLRRFILDLAVRGKLVDQDPDDEPASELLKRIETKKERLIADGVIKDRQPTLDAPCTNEPFPLPATWRWVHFGCIADFAAGRTPPRHDLSYWNDGGYPWVSIADMKDGEEVCTTKETITDKAMRQVFRCEPVPAGTMIMSFKLTIGKMSRLGVSGFHNEAIISIFPHLPELDPYLFLALPSCARRGKTKGAIKGATLNRTSLTRIAIPLAPLFEQQRIVAKMDELMALCDQLEAAQAKRENRRDRLARASLHRLNQPAVTSDVDTFRTHARFVLDHLPRLTTRVEHIAELRQTILNLAVRGKLVAQDPNDEPASELLERIDVERTKLIGAGTVKKERARVKRKPKQWPFELPTGWAATQLRSVVFSLQTGPFGSSLHKSDYVKGGVPVINPACIKDGEIIPLDGMTVGADTARRLATFKLNARDVVLGRRGEMGRCAVVPPQAEGWLCGTGSLILRLPPSLYPQFLALLIGSPIIRQHLTGASIGIIMQSLNQSILMDMMIALPPVAEQQRIVAKVDELMALCDRFERQLTTASTNSWRLLQAILHEALSESDGDPAEQKNLETVAGVA